MYSVLLKPQPLQAVGDFFDQLADRWNYLWVCAHVCAYVCICGCMRVSRNACIYVLCACAFGEQWTLIRHHSSRAVHLWVSEMGSHVGWDLTVNRLDFWAPGLHVALPLPLNFQGYGGRLIPFVLYHVFWDSVSDPCVFKASTSLAIL